MQRRRIQLIAGSTYSVSLPKQWVKKSKLKEKDELLLHEKSDGTLLVSPQVLEDRRINEITLNVPEYLHNLDQILFAVYYLGIETVNLYSRDKISKEAKTKIRKSLTNMSGTEISYEDEKKVIIRVLLDKSKVEISQVLNRINLVIEMSIENILGKMDINEIRINENEIDRLYHLITKITSVSLIDSNILASSNIGNTSLIPHYFLLSKRLENIGDNLNDLAKYLKRKRLRFNNKEFLALVKKELNRSMKHVKQKFPTIFQKMDAEELKRANLQVSRLPDPVISDHLKAILKYVDDIEDEVVNLSFYNQLIRDKVI